MTFIPAYEIRIDATKAKIRVSRTLPLSPITVDAISELISIHPEEWKGKAPIFCTNEGKDSFFCFPVSTFEIVEGAIKNVIPKGMSQTYMA